MKTSMHQGLAVLQNPDGFLPQGWETPALRMMTWEDFWSPAERGEAWILVAGSQCLLTGYKKKNVSFLPVLPAWVRLSFFRFHFTQCDTDVPGNHYVLCKGCSRRLVSSYPKSTFSFLCFFPRPHYRDSRIRCDECPKATRTSQLNIPDKYCVFREK